MKKQIKLTKNKALKIKNSLHSMLTVGKIHLSAKIAKNKNVNLKRNIKKITTHEKLDFNMKKILQFILKLQTKWVVIFFILISTIILGISIRGNAGNPTEQDLNTSYWHDNGPFELSPERGRFALTYSLIENKSFYFSLPIAKFATPDVGYTNGQYVSLFAPAVSFIIMPGYIIGKYFGLSQVGALAIISIFALINLLLIRLTSIKLGATSIAGTIAGFVFVFATPAYAYGVTLYQHHISTFLILLTFYILLRWNNWLSLGIVWLLFASSIPVDYPNLFLMAPLAIYATTRVLWIEKKRQQISFNIKPLYILTPILMLIPLLFYIWFSQNSYGKPLQLAGTIQSVDTINAQGKPANSKLATDSNVEKSASSQPQHKESATAFFQTRNMLNGLYIHLLSPDRGVIFFTPIVLFGIAGFWILWKKNQVMLSLIVGVIGADILLYSMWGDPWGGWAFGSRYLIPAYSMCSILIAIALTKLHKNILFIALFTIIAIYSISVNTLGALTSSANPPKVQVLTLEKQTGIPQKYTYERNIDYLTQAGTKSFAYKQYFENSVTPVQFYFIVTSVLVIAFIGGLILLYIRKYE